MKIQTNNRVHIGQSIKFARGIKVTFDGKGVAEVNDLEGEFLLGYYKGILFLEGKMPKETPFKPTTVKEGATVEEFKEKLSSANQIIEGLKKEVSQAKEGEGVWRKKCQELIDTNDQLKKGQLPSEEFNKLKSEFDELLVGYGDLKIQYDQIVEEKNKLQSQLENKETESLGQDLSEEDLKKKKLETDLELKKVLKSKKKDELLKMAKELELPEDQWKDLSKEDLIEYLIEKSNT